jgi:hypothetical protein
LRFTQAFRVRLRNVGQVNRAARALDSESFRSAGKPTDHTLIACGLAFAAGIEPMKKVFIVYGISPGDVTVAVRAPELALRDNPPERQNGPLLSGSSTRSWKWQWDICVASKPSLRNSDPARTRERAEAENGTCDP